MRLSKKNIRYNILIILTYLVGVVIIGQLFNLQIVQGNNYLEQANARLTRETTIKAARGNILDRNGIMIAGNTAKYSLEIYKTKVEQNVLNRAILNATLILDQNGDKYTSNNFPIDLVNKQYKFSTEEGRNNWLTQNGMEKDLPEDAAIQHYIEKYELQELQYSEIAKIIPIRYGMEKEGYSSKRPYVISSNICEKSVAQFKEQSNYFPGISVSVEPTRSYRCGSLASHILGYVGKIDEEEYNSYKGYGLNDYIGKTGIEFVLEPYLKGENGLKQVDMSIDGATTGEYVREEAVGGRDVVLTIDAKIQDAAERALKEIILEMNDGAFGKREEPVKAGSAVVLDVKTGEVIALCSYPDFEPQLFADGISSEKWEEYTKPGESALINRAIQSAYAPGSIFKMVTAIAGLETGKITINEKINDTGIYPNGHKPRCWIYNSAHRGHGYLNVSDAIKHSCNFFFYEVGSRVGIEEIERYATFFGLGQKTNIELPGENAGTLAGKKLYKELKQTWYYGNTLSAAIGQAENNFTPIQIVKYVAMLANGGNDVDVTTVKEVVNKDGSKIDANEINRYVNARLGLKEIEKEDIFLNDENLAAVLEGMRSVTTETGGTAYATFKNFEIEVGGKTGSAEAGDQTNAWFVGFAPYEQPEIAIVVLVEDGKHGSNTAGVAKRILEAYFGLNDEIEEDKLAEPYM